MSAVVIAFPRKHQATEPLPERRPSARNSADDMIRSEHDAAMWCWQYGHGVLTEKQVDFIQQICDSRGIAP